MLSGEMQMKLRIICLVLVLPFAVAACNTARGIGQDATAAGHAVVGAAQRVTGKSDSNAPATPAEGTSAAPASSTPEPASK